MIGFKFDDIEGSIKEFEQELDEVDKRAKQIILNAGDAIQLLARESVPVDLDDLRDSITKSFVFVPNVSYTTEVKPTMKYGASVEFGSRPHSPPIEALQGWADRHNIPVGVVFNSIRKNGVKPKPYLYPAYNRVLLRLEKLVSRLVRTGK